MALSEADDRWNKMTLAESEKERVFVREAVEAGFSIREAEFLVLLVDMDKYEERQRVLRILKQPVD